MYKLTMFFKLDIDDGSSNKLDLDFDTKAECFEWVRTHWRPSAYKNWYVITYMKTGDYEIKEIRR